MVNTPRSLQFKELLASAPKPPSAALSDTIRSQRVRLTKALSAHYDALRIVAPSVPERVLIPRPPEHDPVLMPSAFVASERQRFGLQGLADIEVEVRIGHAHDVIDKIRGALAVRSAMNRATTVHNGYDGTTRAKESVRRSEVTVRQWQSVYMASWAALARLGVGKDDVRLAGLKPLDKNDLIVLGKWLEGQQYKDKTVRLPWIWTIRPLNGDASDDARVWNDEGAFPMSPLHSDANALNSGATGMGSRKGRLGKMVGGVASSERGDASGGRIVRPPGRDLVGDGQEGTCDGGGREGCQGVYRLLLEAVVRLRADVEPCDGALQKSMDLEVLWACLPFLIFVVSGLFIGRRWVFGALGMRSQKLLRSGTCLLVMMHWLPPQDTRHLTVLRSTRHAFPSSSLVCVEILETLLPGLFSCTQVYTAPIQRGVHRSCMGLPSSKDLVTYEAPFG